MNEELEGFSEGELLREITSKRKNFENIAVGDTVNLSDLPAPGLLKELYVEESEFRGSLEFRRDIAKGIWVFKDSIIERNARLDKSTFQKGLILNSVIIGENLNLNGATVEGYLDLRGIEIGGFLQIKNLEVEESVLCGDNVALALKVFMELGDSVQISLGSIESLLRKMINP